MSIESINERLERLCINGERLLLRLAYETSPEQFAKNDEKLVAELKKMPQFVESYQVWYTEALELLRQTFPQRVDDFVSYLNPPKTRKDILYSNYTISDALRGVRVRAYGDTIADASGAVAPMQQQVQIIESVKENIDSVLVNLRAELQANLFDNDLDASRELNKKGFARAAGMIAGVVMEGHLRETLSRRGIKLAAKNPTISTLNDALKDAAVLDIGMWRRVQAVGDVRNQCGHKTGKEPAAADITRMIDDVSDLIKRIA